MALTVRVSGQAEFSHIKREVKDLNSSFKGLSNTIQKGIGQGFMSSSQSRIAQYFLKQLEDGQKRINSLLDEERTKIEDIQRKYKNASGERRQALKDELRERQNILKTYEDELAAIERNKEALRKTMEGLSVRPDATGGGGAGNLLGGLLGASKGLLSLMGIAGIGATAHQGIMNAVARRKMMADLGMRISPWAPDSLYGMIKSTGLRYGYNALESMGIVDAYGNPIIGSDLAGLQKFARAFGLDGAQVAGAFGQFKQLGAYRTGEQQQFANMIAKAIDEGKMSERATEAMEATANLMADLADRIPEVSGRSLLALQTLMNQTGIQGFMGERGASFLSKLNSMFTSGNIATETFVLRALGWGRDKSYIEAKRLSEQALDNPANLSAVLQRIKEGSGGNTDIMDMVLAQMTGISLTQAQAFRQSTNGYSKITAANLKSIQSNLEKGGTLDTRLAAWDSSVGAWVTKVDAQLEEAIAGIGDNMIDDFYQMKQLTAGMLSDFAQMFGGGKDFLGLSGTTWATLGLIGLTGGGGALLGKLGSALFKGGSGGAGTAGGATAGGILKGASKLLGRLALPLSAISLGTWLGTKAYNEGARFNYGGATGIVPMEEFRQNWKEMGKAIEIPMQNAEDKVKTNTDAMRKAIDSWKEKTSAGFDKWFKNVTELWSRFVGTGTSSMSAAYRPMVGIDTSELTLNPHYNKSISGTSIKFGDLIDKYAKQYNVDPYLIAEIARQESSFNHYTKNGKILTSKAGALGIMQLMPATAKGLGVDPYDLEENLKGGTQYFASLLKTWNGNVPLALASYNGGIGNVKKWIEKAGGSTNWSDIAPYAFGETRDYVNKIMSRWRPDAPLPVDVANKTFNTAAQRIDLYIHGDGSLSNASLNTIKEIAREVFTQMAKTNLLINPYIR